ncbi:alpha/beta fold hydrolase [Xenorhabdus thuongxuanensis]|uniref:AB hydrolase-1 domain-containing protein n=1 Tax=Xenorhabdus thuongxuanensis TaxID=1873484 RepID=A0A1Q5U3X7_9GAMM|nr:alpha/beta hydrolase [Xenorhabdus thuongxuanensis]OKP07178.1 hypothetical protein Xentx_01447 [Xenorhabdus thuongxuanensis]
MTARILVSGFFLRRGVWSPNLIGEDVDDIRDQSECDLQHWLDEAEMLASTFNKPIEIIGHSFGGYLAQCLAARLGDKVSHLWLLSALTSQGGSALESYQESGQEALSEICRLDISSGRIYLHKPERFLTLLGQPVPLASSEPVQLLLAPPPPRITNLSCPVSYVITQQDLLTPPLLQHTFASRLNARLINWIGGHMSPLMESEWLHSR